MGRILALLMALPLAAAARGPSLHEHLGAKIAELEESRRATLADRPLEYRKDLADFYRKRECRPAWMEFGHPAPRAWQLLDGVRKSYLEGLEPEEYHARAMDSLLARFTKRTFWRLRMDARAAAELDILLSDAYLKLAYDLLSGRIRPKTLSDKWHISYEEADLPAYLEETIGNGDPRESLKKLAPPQPEYGAMKYWLREYREIQARGGWPRVPPGPALKPGSAGPRVEALCRRLQAERRIRGSCGMEFSESLREALQGFQWAHGLEADGVADAATLAALNVPVARRISQIKLNLECWRWLPQELGERHIRVNIADFSLRAMEGGEEKLFMKVVVGRKRDSTPVFSDRITAVTLNPAWHVPDEIAKQEILPGLKEDPRYLELHGMELLQSWARGSPPLRADSIDWAAMDTAGFKFKIRQKQGDGSALGKIKFALNNPFNIYLHDTPAKRYFDRDRRALSHGCVRVEKPLDLAAWVLEEHGEWDKDRLKGQIDRGRQESISVPGPGMPVHILYWTAFIDKEGGLQFRPDFYGWDARLETALREKSRTF